LIINGFAQLLSVKIAPESVLILLDHRIIGRIIARVNFNSMAIKNRFVMALKMLI